MRTQKAVFAILVGLLVTFIPSGTVYAALTDGLVAYYPFNGNANDESGHGNNGVIVGATLTTDRLGNPNSAYNFNGIDNYTQVPHNQSFDITSGGFTVAGWFNANSSQLDPSGIYAIIDKSHGDNGMYDDRSGWAIQAVPDGRGLSNAVGIGLNFNYWGETKTNTSVLDNTWHHVTATFQGTTMKIYLDGNLRDSFVFSSGETPVNNTRDLFFGRHYALGRYFRGTIDEIRIYNRELTIAEINELAGKPPLYGCVTLKGSPVVAAPVMLKQTAVSNQNTTTDNMGCYSFPTIVSGKTFSITINGPTVP